MRFIVAIFISVVVISASRLTGIKHFVVYARPIIGQQFGPTNSVFCKFIERQSEGGFRCSIKKVSHHMVRFRSYS